jgi:hypothetical protein
LINPITGTKLRSGPPLSAADPNQFRKYFEPVLVKVEAVGVMLAGFEVGNEINSPMFNRDFSMPAAKPVRPRESNLADISHDPEAQQVAKGYLQYLELFAVKDVRSRSRLNQHTPIVSAGLVFNEAPKAPRKARLHAVSGPATPDFMRAHGLDDLLDIYGVHTYPWTEGPGNPGCRGAADYGSGVQGKRQRRRPKADLADCAVAAATISVPDLRGKPAGQVVWVPLRLHGPEDAEAEPIPAWP